MNYLYAILIFWFAVIALKTIHRIIKTVAKYKRTSLVSIAPFHWIDLDDLCVFAPSFIEDGTYNYRLSSGFTAKLSTEEAKILEHHLQERRGKEK